MGKERGGRTREGEEKEGRKNVRRVDEKTDTPKKSRAVLREK